MNIYPRKQIKLKTLIAASAALAIASTAQAASVTQDPIFDNGTQYVLPIDILNDDTGAIYNTATVQTSLLVDALAAYNSITVADVILQIDFNIDSGASNNDLGWDAVFDSSGDLQYANNGIIVNVTYDPWETGGNIKGFLFVDKSLAPLGIEYGEINQNLVEAEDQNALTPTFMGSAQNYVVVPEPNSLALLGLGGLALMRRRREK